MTLRLRSDERGLTLAELLVTIALLSVVMTLVVTMFVSFSTALRSDRAASDNTAAATIAMNEVTRVIRSATAVEDKDGNLLPAIVEAGRATITVHAYLDTTSVKPRPVKVVFTINSARELIEERWAGVPVTGKTNAFGFPARTSTRTVVRQIDRGASGTNAIFTFFDPDNTAFVLANTAALSSTSRNNVAAVQVRLKVQTDSTGRAKPAVLQNLVGMPNLGVTRLDVSS